jgi:hypothetical protein
MYEERFHGGVIARQIRSDCNVARRSRHFTKANSHINY